MSSSAIATVEKMLESLPEDLQERVVEHLRETILDLQDELHWDRQFQQTQDQLRAAAQQAKKDIASGRAKPMDWLL